MLATNSEFTSPLSLYLYKQDLALSNLQGLICHKAQPTSGERIFGIFLLNVSLLHFSGKLSYVYEKANDFQLITLFCMTL